MKIVTQEHPMGCAVACVAALIGRSYKSTLTSFRHPEHASTRGYNCKEICEGLAKNGVKYSWKKVNSKSISLLKQEGSIVLVARSKKYPAGHFLLKTKKGWMNPWINFQCIKPAKSGFQSELHGKPEWIIFLKVS